MYEKTKWKIQKMMKKGVFSGASFCLLIGKFADIIQNSCPEDPVIKKEQVHPDIVNAVRCLRANRKEKDDNLAVEQAYVQIPGFESQRTFNRVFRERYRMTPREYRTLYKEKYLREGQT